MKFYGPEALAERMPLGPLLAALEAGFRADITVPLRHHHMYANPTAGQDSTLLLMPAWESASYLGVKLITVSPENPLKGKPSIQGIYLLADVATGTPQALLDAKTLTLLRTSAASALASRYLSREETRSMVMVGTGALAPYLIRAHAGVRPIEQVWVWGRSQEKAEGVVEALAGEAFQVEATTDLAAACQAADLISCATMAKEPLVAGAWLRPGQHLDLVGSYLPDHREADDAAVRRSVVYVDIMEGATHESGDIVVPLKNGTLTREAIRGDLFDLCRGRVPGREDADSITYFKSVGHALEDLAAAMLVVG